MSGLIPSYVTSHAATESSYNAMLENRSSHVGHDTFLTNYFKEDELNSFLSILFIC